MRRKKKDTQLENINLIRKIAWTYKKQSKESFNDLFQEGFIGYMKAIETYDPKKGAFSTHAWYCISSHIKDYLKGMGVKDKLLQAVDDLLLIRVEVPHTDFFESLPEESLQIAEVILSAPKQFVVRPKEEVNEQLFEMLSKAGWPMEKIYFGIEQLTKACCI